MWCEIPDHVHVVLEEPKIYPHGIVVIELSECVLLQEFTNLSDRRREQERMVHHDFQVLLLRELDQFFRLRRIAGERLLDKYVLAIFQSSLGQFVVCPNWRHNSNGIDLGRCHEFAWVRNNLYLRVVLVSSFSCRDVEVTECQNLRFRQMFEIPKNFRAPIPVPDHPKAHDITAPLGYDW